MSLTLKIAIAAITFVILTALTLISSYVHYHNYAVDSEKLISKTYLDMENILSQGSTQVIEAASVSSEYAEQVRSLLVDTTAARYGEGGSQATFQFLYEDNPQLDPAMSTKIQQMVESFRNKFQNSQSKFIDVREDYIAKQNYLWAGFWIRVAGYPKLNMDDYQIISSKYAKDSFESNTSEALELF